MAGSLSKHALKLHDLVPLDSTLVANKTLRRRLGVTDGEYDRARKELLDAGLIQIRQGPGGCVQRRRGDEEELLAHVPQGGSAIGNIVLRRRLQWDFTRYRAVRDQLIDKGILALGVGGGRSVSRVSARPHKAAPSGPRQGAVAVCQGLNNASSCSPRLPTPAAPRGRGETQAPRGPTRVAPGASRGAEKTASVGPTMHRVRQAFTTSCGIAVVAMFACVEHDEALAAIFPNSKRKRAFYTTYKDVMRALDAFGVEHDVRSTPVRSWDEIPSTSLVLVKSRNSEEGWRHWVIFRKRADGKTSVLDPAPGDGTLTLTPAGRSRYLPVSYLHVEPNTRPPARQAHGRA